MKTTIARKRRVEAAANRGTKNAKGVRVQRMVRVSSRGWWLVYRRYPDDGAEEKVALVLGKKAALAELAFNRRSFVRGKGVRHYARKASDLDFAWWAGAGNSNEPSSATSMGNKTRKQPAAEREDAALDAIISGVLNGFTEEDWQKVFERMGAAADKPERALAERAKLVRQQRVGRPRESKRQKQSLPELPCVHKDCANWKSSGCWHATICEDHRLPKEAEPTEPSSATATTGEKTP